MFSRDNIKNKTNSTRNSGSSRRAGRPKSIAKPGDQFSESGEEIERKSPSPDNGDDQQENKERPRRERILASAKSLKTLLYKYDTVINQERRDSVNKFNNDWLQLEGGIKNAVEALLEDREEEITIDVSSALFNSALILLNWFRDEIRSYKGLLIRTGQLEYSYRFYLKWTDNLEEDEVKERDWEEHFQRKLRD